MRQAKYIWQLPEEQELPQEFIDAATEFQLSPLAAKLLWQRHIHTPEEIKTFLKPTMEQLHDPYLLHDMARAVERIQQAIMEEEHILIYGDYDADGITSTTIMKETLELLGAKVDFFLPNRFLHGYGPNKEVYEEKIQAGVQLIITVDNGVAGHEAIAFARQQEIDVIITDHHELPEQLPDAYAIIHPRHPEGQYPFGDLAGAGVAYKVATALLEEAPIEFLDLAAIGTVADLVSLTDENRALVKLGMQVMKQSERLGLLALMKVSGVNTQTINASSVGFALGPRLNAIGRLGDPSPAVELLSTFDEEEAASLAEELDTINTERKKIVEEIAEDALTMIDETNDIHLLAKKGWHEGVLGIVAGKIMQETGKPAILLSIKDDGSAKGSGRSNEAVNLYEMLSSMKELFTHFGGHHAAVGLTLPVEHLSSLQQKMNDYIQEHQIDLSAGAVLLVDEKLQPEDVSTAFINELDVLAPFGTDNAEPLFLFSNVQASQLKQIGAAQQHLKFTLNQQLDVVAFGYGDQLSEMTDMPLQVVGKLTINEWNGLKKPQVMLEDYAVSGVQLFDWRAKAKRNTALLTSDTLFISFTKAGKKHVFPDLEEQIQLFDSLEQMAEIMNNQEWSAIVFLDCPSNKELVKDILSIGTFSRVYCLFESTDEAYVNGVGSREQYARLFHFIKQQEQVDVRYKLNAVAAHVNIPEKLLIFMIRVFFDLGFVTIDNGVMRKVEKPQNHPLTDSPTYQQRIQQIKTEEFLLLSSVAEIKDWLAV